MKKKNKWMIAGSSILAVLASGVGFFFLKPKKNEVASEPEVEQVQPSSGEKSDQTEQSSSVQKEDFVTGGEEVPVPSTTELTEGINLEQIKNGDYSSIQGRWIAPNSPYLREFNIAGSQIQTQISSIS